MSGSVNPKRRRDLIFVSGYFKPNRPFKFYLATRAAADRFVLKYNSTLKACWFNYFDKKERIF